METVFITCWFCCQDPFPLGEVVIGSASEGFSVDENAPDDLGGGESAFMFNATTRTYPLLAETTEEKHVWVKVLREVIDTVSSSPNGQDRGTSYSRDQTLPPFLYIFFLLLLAMLFLILTCDETTPIIITFLVDLICWHYSTTHAHSQTTQLQLTEAVATL